MPNLIDASGLTIKTRDQILAELRDGADGFLGLLAIYGNDINLDPNTPDGQLLQLYTQAEIDVLEFLQQIYNGMDPDQAIGRTLDARCAINGVTRKGGTYTLQNVSVTVTQATTIQGLSSNPSAPFTVADAAGNRFLLLADCVFTGPSTGSLAFRSEKLGAIITTPNTINRLVTIQLGVASVNNPTDPTSIGINEETDNALRIRRSQSVAVPSKGYLQGLYGSLLSIDTVTAALVLENTTNTTDANGIPGHSIWAIVNGGTNAEVAQAIYTKRNAGCGMKGNVTENITQVDGTIFPVKFDRPTPEALWISFTLTAITGIVPDATYVRTQLLAALSYTINQPADASAIVALLKAIAPNCYISSEGVSYADAGYVSFKTTTGVNYQWALDAARIYVNGVHG